ncbi:MAG TPA: aminopeptidase [Spirochaetota bacterium]|nr:aminopeptidase [Spirochaetota bacterium]
MKKELEKYAEIVIKKGINLYKGQCLNIETSKDDYDFSLILAETAYKNGAKYVNINVLSNDLTKYRVLYSSEYLDYLPYFLTNRYLEQLADDWANIRIDNTSEQDVLKEVPTDLLDKVTKTERFARRRLLEEYGKHKHSWCVICSPNENWAKKSVNGNVDNLWNILKPILRLDKEEPLKAWDEHGKILINRAETLNKLNLKKLEFRSKNCELNIYLTETSIWCGGPHATPDGRYFIANIPTEEIFTVPDYRMTEGKVKCSRPVKIMERVINGVWFEFKNGEVVNFGSDNDTETLEKFINTDSNSKYLGEVALVDKNSPIYKSGVIFNTILYDENAASHIALGNGYPSCLSNGSILKNKEDLLNAGCNVSLVHTDFMIGSEDMTVFGIDRSNKKHTIIDNGIFVI